MVQKIHPLGVIWVQSFRLMWADQLKKLTAVPSRYQEVHALTYLYTLWRTIVSASARVSFSPGHRNLIKTLEIEGPIIRWSQNWDSIFAWELLNNQKYLSKSAKIWFFFSFRNIKGQSFLLFNYFFVTSIFESLYFLRFL